MTARCEAIFRRSWELIGQLCRGYNRNGASSSTFLGYLPSARYSALFAESSSAELATEKRTAATANDLAAVVALIHFVAILAEE
jgi:hypothetical protein